MLTIILITDQLDEIEEELHSVVVLGAILRNKTNTINANQALINQLQDDLQRHKHELEQLKQEVSFNLSWVVFIYIVNVHCYLVVILILRYFPFPNVSPHVFYVDFLFILDTFPIFSITPIFLILLKR